MNKKIFFFLIIVIIIIILIIFIKNNYKNTNIVNNIINQSADKIKENILNIESYKARVTIEVKSNKNINTYEAIQMYYKENNLYKQEMLEPQFLKGIIFSYNGTNLKIQNTQLNISKIYENYNYIESNELSISSFIEDYKLNEENKSYEEDENIVLETTIKNNNKYRKIKKLYINKNTAKPNKMEIQDVSKNTLVYILYNEIELNKLKKEEIN